MPWKLPQSALKSICQDRHWGCLPALQLPPQHHSLVLQKQQQQRQQQQQQQWMFIRHLVWMLFLLFLQQLRGLRELSALLRWGLKQRLNWHKHVTRLEGALRCMPSI